MLFFVVNVFSQRIIYSEDFSTDNGAGFDNGWIAPTSSTWTMVLVGSPDVTGGGDYCAVYNNRLEWQDLASTSMSNRVDWYSPVISGIYNNISISLDWYTNGTSCGGIQATLDIYYRIDGGSWVRMANPSSALPTSGTATASGLTCSSSIELLVQGSTADCANALAYIDNVIVTANCSSFYSGIYEIGAGGQWETLTEALQDIKGCIAAPVVLELNEYYKAQNEASEIYPLRFSNR